MIEIYGTSTCKWCKEAQNLCLEKNLPYLYYWVDRDPSLLHELEDRLDQKVRSVPQIFMDGEYVGSYSDLREKIND